jgi:hypothetical protein
LATYYVLFFLHLETRRVSLTGITRHPAEEWMTQMGRNATDGACGCLRQHRYVLHDRDSKFCAEFRETLAAGGVKCLRLPARSPNLNAFAERWVRSVKEECLSKLMLFGEASLFEGHFLRIDRPPFLSSKVAVVIQEQLKRFVKSNERFEFMRVGGFLNQVRNCVGS